VFAARNITVMSGQHHIFIRSDCSDVVRLHLWRIDSVHRVAFTPNTDPLSDTAHAPLGTQLRKYLNVPGPENLMERLRYEMK
jgi:hypothetical protein